MAAPGAVAKEVGRALSAFVRAVRGRRLYKENNAALARMVGDAHATFTEALKLAPQISLRVRPDAFVLDDMRVYEEDTTTEESIPLAFFRDGIRRLDISAGFDRNELEVLIAAAEQGAGFVGLGDDTVSFLWRHDLEHVHYLVVDTAIIDAAAESAGTADPMDSANALDQQIEGLLVAIYGGGESTDTRARSLQVDETDLAARSVARGFDRVAKLSPGFRPLRHYDRAAFADELSAELEQDHEREVRRRVIESTLDMLALPISQHSSAMLSDAVLRVYDGALIEADLPLAKLIIARMLRASGRTKGQRASIERVIDEMLSEARLRQVAAMFQVGPEAQEAGVEFFRACGRRAVPMLLSILPGISEPLPRRRMSDLITDIGVSDASPVIEMLKHEQIHVVQEAMYLLPRIRTSDAVRAFVAARDDPRPHMRLALLENASHLAEDDLPELAGSMLSDSDVKVRVAAAGLLSRVRNARTARLIEGIVKNGAFKDEPMEVKKAFLVCYAELNQLRSLLLLASFIKDATGLFARKPQEELGVAAVEALAKVPAPKALEMIKDARGSRNKKIKDAALAVRVEGLE